MLPPAMRRLPLLNYKHIFWALTARNALTCVFLPLAALQVIAGWRNLSLEDAQVSPSNDGVGHGQHGLEGMVSPWAEPSSSENVKVGVW